MKRYFIPIITVLTLFRPAAYALDHPALQDSVAGGVQLRTGADANFNFEHGGINISEELRFNLAPTPEMYLANTTIGADVKIVKGYLNGHAGYMLRIRGNKFSTGDASKIIRHRIFFGLNEHVKFGTQQQFTLSLRERAVLDMRFDEPNAYEKQAYAWEMRYRLHFQYKSFSLPLTPYIWSELSHTCNATEYQKYYNNGHNYINAVKTAVGLKWKLNMRNTLNFYVRYDWKRDFDIDANKDGTTIKTAQQVIMNQAIIGINYTFGWKKR